MHHDEDARLNNNFEIWGQLAIGWVGTFALSVVAYIVLRVLAVRGSRADRAHSVVFWTWMACAAAYFAFLGWSVMFRLQ